MTAIGLSPVLPVPDLEAAVGVWTKVLGIEPTFVDGDKWAQFDLGDRRLILADTDRPADTPAILVKVADVAQARADLARTGLAFAAPVVHGKEWRSSGVGPGGWTVVLYGPAPSRHA